MRGLEIALASVSLHDRNVENIRVTAHRKLVMHISTRGIERVTYYVLSYLRKERRVKYSRNEGRIHPSCLSFVSSLFSSRIIVLRAICGSVVREISSISTLPRGNSPRREPFLIFIVILRVAKRSSKRGNNLTSN